MIRKLLLPVVFAAFLVDAAPAAATAKARYEHVPRLTGDTLAQARRTLTRDHLKTGRLIGTHAGIVKAQVPKAGRKVKRGTKVALTFKAKPKTPPATTTPAPQYSYQASVGSTLTQSPTNPLVVTYSYSANATETSSSGTQDLASTGQLPDGVLNFYGSTTPGGAQTQICSINVGGATSSGSCTVTYANTGTYQVSAQYAPAGASAVTSATQSETVSPFTTTTDLAVDEEADGANLIIGAAAGVIGPSGAAVGASLPITYTITDTTAGTVVATIDATTAGCGLIDTWDGGDLYTVTSSGCSMNAFNIVSYNTYVITAAFAGMPGYDASTSTPWTIWTAV